MKTSLNESRREVMKNAHRFFQVTGENFAKCLRKAWSVYRLSSEMETKTVQFFYQKSNGNVRQAFGTMRQEVISGKVKGTDTRKRNADLFVYYDTEKDAFRSFKKFNLIQIA